MNRYKLILALAIAAVVLLSAGEPLLAGQRRGTTIIANNSNVYVFTNGRPGHLASGSFVTVNSGRTRAHTTY